jgi:hypothetical protein
LSPSGVHHTQFSGALIEVLRTGERSGKRALSLEDVGQHVKNLLRARYPEDWVRPEVHSPDMREGDLANTPIFPNPKFEVGLIAAPESGGAEYVRSLESLVHARTEQVQAAIADLERSYDITLQVLGDSLDLRTREGADHCRCVTAFTMAIARSMGVPAQEIDVMSRAAFLHDIGKMAIPDRILFKPGKLNDEEIAMMREHPSIHAQPEAQRYSARRDHRRFWCIIIGRVNALPTAWKCPITTEPCS